MSSDSNELHEEADLDDASGGDDDDGEGESIEVSYTPFQSEYFLSHLLNVQ